MDGPLFLAIRAVDGDPWFTRRVSAAAEVLGLVFTPEKLRTEALAVAVTHSDKLSLRVYDDGRENPDEVDCSGLDDLLIMRGLLARNRDSVCPIVPLAQLGIEEGTGEVAD